MKAKKVIWTTIWIVGLLIGIGVIVGILIVFPAATYIFWSHTDGIILFSVYWGLISLVCLGIGIDRLWNWSHNQHRPLFYDELWEGKWDESKRDNI
jgi:hypothetical protein